jgi:putative tricarboxylic transport membrane protein
LAVNDLFANLAHGFSVAVTIENLAFCFVGALLGTLVGVLPGLGPVATLAILLPVTFNLDPVGALIMLAGIYYGAQYGGSISAILLNLPGEASSVVTTLDGHAMAQQGRAGEALSVSAVGSFIAGTFAALAIALFAPALAEFALTFRPADYFALMLLGLVLATVLARGPVMKGVAMMLIGVFLGLVGTDVNDNSLRYTLGIPALGDGIGFVPLAMGLFGIADIAMKLEARASRVSHERVGRIRVSRETWWRSFPAILRGTAIGSILGVLPGGGSILGAFSAYLVEKRIAKDPSRFGKGAIEGVAAPESANNAGAQTAFVPLLTLGIPGNAVMAMMAGALTIHGITPGPQVMTANADLFWGLIASMWLGNLMLLAINLPLVGVWARLLDVPYRFLFPAIVLFCCIGAFAMKGSAFDVGLTAFFGVAGYVLLKFGFEPAPLVLGFVLGGPMEENLRRALLLSRGDAMTFLEHPKAVIFLVLAAGLLAATLLPLFRKVREKAGTGEE